MTGYNTTHGDTAAVALNLNNTEGTYKEYQRCVQLAWWDEDDHTWNDVDKAAAALGQYVEELQAYAHSVQDRGNLGEIADAQLAAVDFRELITDELEELNIQEGRAREAGL